MASHRRPTRKSDGRSVRPPRGAFATPAVEPGEPEPIEPEEVEPDTVEPDTVEPVPAEPEVPPVPAARQAQTADGAHSGGMYERLWNTGLPNAAAIAGRELGSLFVSPVFYVVGALLAIAVTVFGYLSPLSASNPFSMGGNVFPLVQFLTVIFAPLYTMRLLADERRAGTLEILLTCPVRDWEVVVGKWLGALVTFLASIAFTLVYVILISILEPLRAQVHWFGQSLEIPAVDYGSILAGYAGLVLFGAAATAIGLLASSLTSNQIISAVVGIVALILLYAGLSFTANLSLPTPLSDFLTYLSISDHALPFNGGRVPLADALYFVTLVVGALFLATRVLESRRWR